MSAYSPGDGQNHNQSCTDSIPRATPENAQGTTGGRFGARAKLLELALRYQTVGFSVIIVGDDKRPVGKWRAAQTRMLTRAELWSNIRRGGTGLAVIGGAASGRLQIPDFDVDKDLRAQTPFDLKAEFVAPWLEAIRDIIDPNTLPCQRTPSGGLQFYYRCATPLGNTKLAGVPAWQKKDGQILVNTVGAPHYAIEMRGQGGYAVIPTPGSNRTWLHGLDLTDTPTISQEVADAIITAARNLDRVPAPVPKTASKKKADYVPPSADESVIDAYNARYTIDDALEQNGYVQQGKDRWLAPNSSSGLAGVSVKDGRAYSHHASDLLGDGHAHDAFGVFTQLEHNGDVTASVKAAADLLGITRAKPKRQKTSRPTVEQPDSDDQDTPKKDTSPPLKEKTRDVSSNDQPARLTAAPQLPELVAPTRSTRLIYLGRDEQVLRRAVGTQGEKGVAFVVAADPEARFLELRRTSPAARFIFVARNAADVEPHCLALEHNGWVGTVREGALHDIIRPDPMRAYPDARGACYRRLLEIADKHGATVKEHALGETPEVLEPGTHLLAQSKGFGKTQTAKRTVQARLEAGDTVLATAHYRSLVGAQAQTCALSHYEDDGGEGVRRFGTDQKGLSTCINSHHKLYRRGQLAATDIYFVDESESLLRRFTSKDDFANKTLCWDAHNEYVRTAKTVILADADTTELTFEYLRRVRPNARPTLHVSRHLPGDGKVIHNYEHRGSVRAAANRHLKSGGNVWMSTDSKGGSLAAYFRRTQPDLPLLHICSDTSGETEVEAFFRDPEGESQKYRIVIASPSVSTGVSLTSGHFTWVGGEFGALVRTPADAMQSLVRVRTATELHVWVNPARRWRNSDPDALRASLLDDADPETLTGKGGTLNIRDADYEALYFSVKEHDIESNNLFSARFWLQVVEEGYTVTEGTEVDDADEIVKEGKTAEDEAYREGVHNALDLTTEEVADLLKATDTRAATLKEGLELERHDLKRVYALPDEPTPEALDTIMAQDERGGLRRRLNALELTVEPETELVIREANELKRAGGRMFRVDRTPYQLLREFRRRALQAVLCDPDTLKTDEDVYSAESETITDWVMWLETMRPKLAGLTGIPALPESDELVANPLLFMRDVLKSVALKQHRRSKGGMKVYQLEQGVLQQRRELFEKRGIIPSALADDAATPTPPVSRHVGPKLLPVPENAAEKVQAVPETTPVYVEKNPEQPTNSTPEVYIVPPTATLRYDGDAKALLHAILRHIAGLSERPTPELAYQSAVCELCDTFVGDAQERVFDARTAKLIDGTPLEQATDDKLRVAALALSAWAQDRRMNGVRNRGVWSWHQDAQEVISQYRPARRAA